MFPFVSDESAEINEGKIVHFRGKKNALNPLRRALRRGCWITTHFWIKIVMLNVVECDSFNSHLIGTEDIPAFHSTPGGNQTCVRTS